MLSFNGVANLKGARSRVITAASSTVGERIDISVVIPLLNEEENLRPLYTQLKPVMAGLGKSYEIIFIDDGSQDSTYSILQELAENDPYVWVVRFRRRFGQTAAFSAGFDMARGDVIITMDGDLQNDAVDIPKLLAKADEGFDVVSGWRVNRQDVFLTRKLPSQIANALISRVTGVRLHDYGCSLKAYRYEVVKNIKLYGEMHRFIPALASWVGIRVAEVPVNHHARKYGSSKYGLGRTIRVVLDLLTVKFLLDYATRPIQIFGLLGLACFSLGTILSAYLTILRLFFNQTLSDRPLLLLAILLIMLGVQFIIMGLLGELVVRTYHEAQGKPIYMIRDVTGGNTLVEKCENEQEPSISSQPTL
ncbi:MAG TPA: glycosyltransferase family 2 protein [Anaerolineales bacterium]